MKNFYATIILLLFFCQLQALSATTLVGWAEMRTTTHSDGPTAFQFNDQSRVIKGKQAVQGFSAVLKAEKTDHFYFLTDNGFGKIDNSADALLRLYEVEINFNVAGQKNNHVKPIKFINLHDSDKKLTFKLQADYDYYYNLNTNPPVDSAIKQQRLLTGGDVDPESVRLDKNGHFWFGDEFGPFLIKTDQTGKVLRQEISVPSVFAPENPYLIDTKPNLGSSAGFEGMAISPSGDRLYPMLEGTVEGDAEKNLRIYQFDIATEQFDEIFVYYHLEDKGTNIGDFVAVNEHEFLVIERNGASQHGGEPYKKIFLIDTANLKHGEFVKKTELVDLMNINDPDDLNSDGNKHFTFPFVTIENLLILDQSTLLVVNDNNFSERTNFIKIKLDSTLQIADFINPKVNTGDWVDNTSIFGEIDLNDHSFFGWTTVLMYLLATLRTGYTAKLTIENKESFYFWLSLTVLLVVLGLNKQLDLQSNLTEWLRASSKAHGWYEQRRGYQLLFITIMGLAIPILLISLRMFLYHSWQRYKLVWVGIVFLLIFVVVRAASFHHVDIIFYQTIGSLRYYQALEMLAISLIIAGTFFENKQIRAVDESTIKTKSIVHIDAEGDFVFCPSCGKKPLAETKHGRVFKCKSCKHMYETRLLDATATLPE